MSPHRAAVRAAQPGDVLVTVHPSATRAAGQGSVRVEGISGLTFQRVVVVFFARVMIQPMSDA